MEKTRTKGFTAKDEFNASTATPIKEATGEILEVEDVIGIIEKGGTILGSSNRDNPFAYRKNREDKPVDMSEQFIKNLKVEDNACALPNK